MFTSSSRVSTNCQRDTSTICKTFIIYSQLQRSCTNQIVICFFAHLPPQLLVKVFSSLCGTDNDIKLLQTGRETGFDINATWFNTNMLPSQGWQDFPVKKVLQTVILVNHIFIRPRSDHSLPLSVTN